MAITTPYGEDKPCTIPAFSQRTTANFVLRHFRIPTLWHLQAILIACGCFVFDSFIQLPFSRAPTIVEATIEGATAEDAGVSRETKVL
jgi:hypothetical protein